MTIFAKRLLPLLPTPEVFTDEDGATDWHGYAVAVETAMGQVCQALDQLSQRLVARREDAASSCRQMQESGNEKAALMYNHQYIALDQAIEDLQELFERT